MKFSQIYMFMYQPPTHTHTSTHTHALNLPHCHALMVFASMNRNTWHYVINPYRKFLIQLMRSISSHYHISKIVMIFNDCHCFSYHKFQHHHTWWFRVSRLVNLCDMCHSICIIPRFKLFNAISYWFYSILFSFALVLFLSSFLAVPPSIAFNGTFHWHYVHKFPGKVSINMCDNEE